MEIEADMNAVFPAKFHGIVNLFQGRLVKLCPVVVLDPHPVIHREPDEIETQFRNPFEILFPERIVSAVEFFQQVEAVPARELAG